MSGGTIPPNVVMIPSHSVNMRWSISKFEVGVRKCLHSFGKTEVVGR